MPDDPTNLDDNRDEKPPFDDNSKHPKPEDKHSNDPFGIKSVAGGVMVLVLICGFLFVFAKLGQIGSAWIGDTVDSALSTGEEVQEESSDEGVEAKELEPAELAAKTKTSKPAPAQIPIDETPSQSARRQLIEQLDPDKYDVRVVVFSKDKTSILAAIRFLDEKDSKLKEVFFDRHELFPSYAPKPGSLLSEDIKLYFEE